MSTRQKVEQVDPLVHLLPDGPVLRRSEAAGAAVGSRTLYRLVERGVVERVRCGLHRRSGGPPVDLDLLEVALRAPRATICLSMRVWLRRPGSSPAVLMNLAERLPRARGPVRQALDHLL